MLTVKEAIELVLKRVNSEMPESPKQEVVKCEEISGGWVIACNFPNDPLDGNPCFVVDKSDGALISKGIWDDPRILLREHKLGKLKKE